MPIKQTFEPPSMSSPHFSTKERILSAAENLFAQYGFAGTSLRQVTSRADVNLAAVNYHFGSKENLVNEVFRRRMDEMSQARLDALAQAKNKSDNRLEAVLAAFIEPALALTLDRQGGSAFVRVLALFSALPVLGQRTVPVRMRVGLAFLIVVAAQASLPTMPVVPLDSPQAFALIVQNLLIGITLGLYICSRPAANGIDLFFAERGTLRRIFTRGTGLEWILLNAAVMIAGMLV